MHSHTRPCHQELVLDHQGSEILAVEWRLQCHHISGSITSVLPAEKNGHSSIPHAATNGVPEMTPIIFTEAARRMDEIMAR